MHPFPGGPSDPVNRSQVQEKQALTVRKSVLTSAYSCCAELSMVCPKLSSVLAALGRLLPHRSSASTGGGRFFPNFLRQCPALSEVSLEV
jgi:hypothetical protein